ncbi:ribosomal protein L21-like protein [Bisporella sp. PMI_857]|nr:ribosomal protein L21-like protein [Bisporella sp. PMI_857]
MLSRSLRRSILDSKPSQVTLPPTFLLPIRARFFNTTQQHIESPPDAAITTPSPSTLSSPLQEKTYRPMLPKVPLAPPPPTTPLNISTSITKMLPLLAAQPSHYISAHIHGRPYLVTAGDIVRLPFLMPGVSPGDILRLNRASSLGSRDYTLKGAPYLDERLFVCRARVMGTESEPMRTKEKKKRRNRRLRTVQSKHRFTILRISEVKVNDLEDIQGQ